LNFNAFSKDLLVIFVFLVCSAFWWGSNDIWFLSDCLWTGFSDTRLANGMWPPLHFTRLRH